MTETELAIHDLARGGAGVARDEDGRIVFVPQTAPQDRVRVRLTSIQKNYADAEVVELLTASPLREKPRCTIFGRCGGCSWQHLPYDLQWKTKVSGVHHALKRVCLQVKDLEEIPAKSPWNYRNRIQLRGEGTRLGFYASQSHEIVEASRCEIAREEINVKWNEVREAGALLKRPYKAEIEVLEDGTLRTVWNAKHGAAGFRQVNDAQNEAMREWVKRHVTPGRVVYDLFGGSGNLSKSLSQVANAIHCVDTSAPRQGSFGNYFFHRAAVLPWLMRFPKNPTTEASAIIDPPRQGLDRQFAAVHSELLKMQVTEVIAVGCDADSWARDLKHFTAKGWSIANAVAIDMFPQTPHVEAIARLTR